MCWQWLFFLYGVNVYNLICLVTFLALFTCQAEREFQPWIAKDDDFGQKMWRINQRIVKLIAELMRNHDTPESLVIVASASDLLLRATDGMLVDGEACTLPQLEVIISGEMMYLPAYNSYLLCHIDILNLSYKIILGCPSCCMPAAICLHCWTWKLLSSFSK